MQDSESKCPVWLQLCQEGELNPVLRMAARQAILAHEQARDCSVYRADEDDEDAEEQDLGDARILFVGPFQAPDAWNEAERAAFFDELDPKLFVTAFIECGSPANSKAFFQPDLGDYVACMTSEGLVEMYFVHDWQEDDRGRLCVLVRDEEPLF